MSRQRIAIDFSQLDSVNPASGQYRYAIALVSGLARLETNIDFLLLGSRKEPVPELEAVFLKYHESWKYRQVPRKQFRGSDYLNHLRYSWVLMRERITVLHALHTFVPLLATCPVVITMYDLMYELFDDYEKARRSRPYRLYKWVVKHVVKRVICISDTTAGDLRQHWEVENDKIDVVPLGSDLSREAIQNDLESGWKHVTDSSPVLLSPFNLEPRKSLGTLLDATSLLVSSGRDLKLILFGRAAVTPEREENFQQRVKELGIEEKIIRTGIITDQELVALYRQATLFVFPSLYEGFGLPLLEAMSAGACVVARDASAMAEVVGRAGVLVETQEPEALAMAIANLLDHAGRRTSLGRLARERAALFNVERMAELTYRSYLVALKQAVQGSAVYVNA